MFQNTTHICYFEKVLSRNKIYVEDFTIIHITTTKICSYEGSTCTAIKEVMV